MNIQQFQYIIAVSELRHFEKAADKCCISQSTLSTMISKFEDEIGIKLFDRKTKPVSVTNEGELIISQLKAIDNQIKSLAETAKHLKGEIKGTVKIGIIPTVAPFLLPLFLQGFTMKFPQLRIDIRELTTKEMIEQLKLRELDIGIASTPLMEKSLKEYPLYNEPFIWYDEGSTKQRSKIDVGKADLSNFWLLEEEHCMQAQVSKICDIEKIKLNLSLNINFRAGSIDSLLRFVKANNGKTLLPYLAILDASEKEKTKFCLLKNPVPMRSIGLVVHQHFVKKKVLNLLQEEIQRKVQSIIPQELSKGKIYDPLNF